MTIQGEIEYFYNDFFTDPLSIREMYEKEPRPEDLNWLETTTEFAGNYFTIRGYWKTKFYAEAKFNEETSIYQWQH